MSTLQGLLAILIIFAGVALLLLVMFLAVQAIFWIDEKAQRWINK